MWVLLIDRKTNWKDQLERPTHDHTSAWQLCYSYIWHPLDDTQRHPLLALRYALPTKYANIMQGSLAGEFISHSYGHNLSLCSLRAHVRKTQATSAWSCSLVPCLTSVFLTTLSAGKADVAKREAGHMAIMYSRTQLVYTFHHSSLAIYPCQLIPLLSLCFLSFKLI